MKAACTAWPLLFHKQIKHKSSISPQININQEKNILENKANLVCILPREKKKYIFYVKGNKPIVCRMKNLALLQIRRTYFKIVL